MIFVYRDELKELFALNTSIKCDTAKLLRDKFEDCSSTVEDVCLQSVLMAGKEQEGSEMISFVYHDKQASSHMPVLDAAETDSTQDGWLGNQSYLTVVVSK